jgi:hypothetical protein
MLLGSRPIITGGSPKAHLILQAVKKFDLASDSALFRKDFNKFSKWFSTADNTRFGLMMMD